MTPRPVLYVHHRPELGGAPSSLAALLRRLDRSRFLPTVYCPGGEAAELFRACGADVVVGPVATFTHIWASWYRGLRWLGCARELARAPLATRRLHSALDRGAYDLVHLNDSPLVYAAAAVRRRGIPVVWHLRSALAHGGRDRRSRAIARLADRTGAAAIAVDADVARTFDLRIPLEIVHNAVDLERFAPGDGAAAKRRLGLPEDRVCVGLFGYLYADKGWPDFLLAARTLLQGGAPAQFVVVGGGVRPPAFFRTPQGRALAGLGLVRDEETAARRMAAELGLGDRVTFLPFAVDPLDAYLALDVVAQPRRGEGIGRVAIEAAACGRPVVASGSDDGAGILLPGETGLLVPQRSPDELAAALRRLVEDPSLRARMGADARAHAEATFDAAKNARAVMDLYDRVLAARTAQ